MLSKSSLLKRIVNVILNIFITIFIIVLLITLYNNLQVTVLKNTYASFFGYSIFEVQTGSMEPSISPGDCVITHYVNEVELDDVITFQRNGEFITHRVIEAYKGTYVTKGDANNAKDEPISREQIVGKVVKIIPNVGAMRSTILNPVVLIGLIITFYLLTFAFKDRKKVVEVDVNIREEKEVKSMKLREMLKSLLKKDEKVVTSKEVVIIPPKEEIKEEVISAVDNEIEDDVRLEEDIIKSDSTDEYLDDELDKTIVFRMVAVDGDELDKSYKKILKLNEEEELKEKKEQIKREKREEKNKSSVKEKVKKPGITDELDRIQKKKKKFKNIIEKAMFIKEDEVSLMVDILLRDEASKPGIPSIKNTFVKTYIDGKYYNYCGNVNLEYTKKNMVSKVNAAMQDKASELIKVYKGNDKKYNDKVMKMVDVFTLIITLETAFLVQEGIRVKRDNYKTKILKVLKELTDGPIVKDMVNQIIEVQKSHAEMVKTSLEKIETNMFKLTTNSVAKNLSAVYLEHNIAFSKVYSDYIVDKTYSEGVVAEDKIAVLLTLLSGQILNDMYACEFNQKYMFYIPESLYTKSNKLSAIFDKFEDEYAKTMIVVLIQYSELSRNSKVVRELIKEGYHFAVDLSKTDRIKSKDMGLMELMSILFMDRKTKDKKEIIASLSDYAQKRVIYDDIEAKVGSFWGDNE